MHALRGGKGFESLIFFITKKSRALIESVIFQIFLRRHFYAKEELFYKERTVDEVIEKLYKDCCDNCDRLADSCRDFLYVANGYYNNGPLATKRYNDDKKLMVIYDHIRWIKEEFDNAKYNYGVRKHDAEKKEEK